MPLDAPPQRVSRRTVRVEWGDCDAAGIVYFPRYFAWFDASTAAAFVSAGFSNHQLIERYGIIGMPVKDVRANFSIPSTFEDELVIETRIAEWGRTSFTVEHRLFKQDDLASVAVEGREVRVWVSRDPANPRRLRPAPIPLEVRERFL
jgi:4-hydroxybenzoyl-CoA thioesterase